MKLKYGCQRKIIEKVGQEVRVFQVQSLKDKTQGRRRVGHGGRNRRDGNLQKVREIKLDVN